MKDVKQFIEQFNESFKGDAKAEIVNGLLEITIGSKTISISLLDIVGVSSMGS